MNKTVPGISVQRKKQKKHKAHLVNRLEFLSYGKDGLDVVVTQFLNQMSDGGVVLKTI